MRVQLSQNNYKRNHACIHTSCTSEHKWKLCKHTVMSKFRNQSVEPISLHKLSRNVAMHHVTKHANCDKSSPQIVLPKKQSIWISTRMLTRLGSQIGALPLIIILYTQLYKSKVVNVDIKVMHIKHITTCAVIVLDKLQRNK